MRLNRFVKSIALKMAVFVLSATACGSVRADSPMKAALSPEAMNRAKLSIGKIMSVKSSLNSTDRKISPAFLPQFVGLTPKGLDTAEVQWKSDGTSTSVVDCEVTCKVSDRIVKLIESLDGKIVYKSPKYGSIRVKMPVSRMRELAADADVSNVRRFIKAETNGPDRSNSKQMATTRTLKKAAEAASRYVKGSATPVVSGAVKASNTSQGDTAHRADQARQQFGVTGNGVKVGVISDSARYLSEMQASGDLPSDITVLSGYEGVEYDDYGNRSDTGEGSGMMEIIYDLAPKAKMYFATGMQTQAGMADAIDALAGVGCNIIVDDVGWATDPAFQDGDIAQALTRFVSNGGIYFSSSANSGNLDSNTSGTWEGDFVNSGYYFVDSNANKYYLAAFNSDGANLNGLQFGNCLTLQWSDKWGNSSNDYDLFLLDSSGNIVTYSADTQSGTGCDPFEGLGTSAVYGYTGYYVAVVKGPNAADRYLRVDTHRGRLGVATAGSTFGHNAADRAITVAAAAAPSGRVFRSTDSVETYSSDGPRRIFYDANGNLLSSGYLSSDAKTLNKVDITAADDTTSKWFELAYGSGGFTGTSAAAPHAAAIAALMLEANPSLTRDDIMDIFSKTTFSTPAWNRTKGYGIIDAYAATQEAKNRLTSIDANTALDNTVLTFTTGGDAEWFGQTANTHDNVDAMQSGAIGNGQSSWLKTTVNGAGTLSFYWLVSSQANSDYLQLVVDGDVVEQISGQNGDWINVQHEIASEGEHDVKWVYSKDSYSSAGQDAGYLDQVTWRKSDSEDLPNLSFALFDDWNYNGYPLITTTGFDDSPVSLFDLESDFVCVWGLANFGPVPTTTGFSCLLEVLDENDSVKASAIRAYNETLGALGDLNGVRLGQEIQASANNLSAGPYVLRCTLDSKNAINESDESDNVFHYTFAIRESVSLGEALDNTTLAFSTSGSASWYGTKGQGLVDNDCVLSPHTDNNSYNDLTTTVSGKGKISFKWKVSSERDYDFLQFLIDGNVVKEISGTDAGWQDVQQQILSTSTHKLTWRFVKDESYWSGMDCGWVDSVVWEPTSDDDDDPEPGPAPTSDTSYALLVGINEYQLSGCSTLSGCVADANAMEMVCTEYGNWEPDNIVKLTDSEATLSRFKSEILNLASKAKAGDTVLIFDSSHGGADTDYYGNYTKDTYICAYDSIYRDADFAADIGNFKSGVKVIVVLDTCHSAGMFKSVMGASEDVRKTFTANFIANVTSLVKSGATQARGIRGVKAPISSSEIGWIAAADYDVSSYEMDGGGIGLFTGYMLVDAGIMNAMADDDNNGKITFKELYEHAKEISSEEGYDQVAQAANVSVLDSVSFENLSVSLSEALDNPMFVEFLNDDEPLGWVGQAIADNAAAGESVARSAVLPNYTSASMSAVVTGPGTLKFKWKVSSEMNYDKLSYQLDGTEVDSISGDRDWAERSVSVSAGKHTVTWRYEKDSSNAEGSDCGWVDEVVWIDGNMVTVTFDANGGTVDEPSRIISKGTAIGELPVPSSSLDYTFEGWYTSREGGSLVTDSTVFTEDTTIFAHWSSDPVPTWPAPGNYENAQTIYAMAFDGLNNDYLDHDNGWMAAFDENGNVRGKTKIQVGPEGLMFMLDVGFNGASEQLTLKYWNPDVGELTAANKVTIQYGEDYGDVYSPKVIVFGDEGEGSNSVDIEIGQGYTWMSLPVSPADASLSTVFSACSFQNRDKISTMGASASYAGGQWYGSLTELVAGKTYVVKKSSAETTTITVSGDTLNGSVSVSSGWNWIGSSSASDVSIANITHSGGFVNRDKISAQAGQGSASYANGQWYGNLTVLKPGVGYKVKLANAGTLTFGQSRGKKGAAPLLCASASKAMGSQPTWSEISSYENAQTVYASIRDGASLATFANGDAWIGAFDANGVIRGKAKVMDGPDGSKMFSLDIGFDGAAVSGLTLKYWDPERGETVLDGTVALANGRDIGDIIGPVTYYAFTKPESETPTTTYKTLPVAMSKAVTSPDETRSAQTYNGYIYDKETGFLKGTVKVNASKSQKNIKSGDFVQRLSISLQRTDESTRVSFTGVYNLSSTDGAYQIFANRKGREISLLLSEEGLTGEFEGDAIVGVPKGTDMTSYEGVYTVFADEGHFTITINNRGVARIAGTTVENKSVSASSTLLAGIEAACLPVIQARYDLAFKLWIESGAVSVEGLTNAVVGKPDTLGEGAIFRIDSAALVELLGDDTYAAYYPCGLSVEQNEKNKWLVAGGARAGQLLLNKNGEVRLDMAGENPSALRLSYTAKTGVFKGSFKAYYHSNGRPKAITFSLTGVLVDGVGYGIATARNRGSVLVMVY